MSKIVSMEIMIKYRNKLEEQCSEASMGRGHRMMIDLVYAVLIISTVKERGSHPEISKIKNEMEATNFGKDNERQKQYYPGRVGVDGERER